jgi:hypothetical protein
MFDEPEKDSILHSVRRVSRFLSNGKITPEEFVSKLFDEFAWDRHALTYLAAQVLALVPETGKRAFVERVDEALRPEFRRQPFRYGGAEPVPEERMRREGEEQTARVRAWAAEFRRLMDQSDARAVASEDH